MQNSSRTFLSVKVASEPARPFAPRPASLQSRRSGSRPSRCKPSSQPSSLPSSQLRQPFPWVALLKPPKAANTRAALCPLRRWSVLPSRRGASRARSCSSIKPTVWRPRRPCNARSKCFVGRQERAQVPNSPASVTMRPNPSIEGTSYGLRPPAATHVKR
jgi:hypothetical protein